MTCEDCITGVCSPWLDSLVAGETMAIYSVVVKSYLADDRTAKT